MSIIVIDFDGTIVESAYPNIGELKPNVKENINKLFNEGHDIIINTCRAQKYEVHAKNFLIENGILFTTINENLEKNYALYENLDPRKISGDIYIDDRQLGGIPNDWNIIYERIKKQLNNQIDNKKYLIIGHGRHGKDTIAQMIYEITNMKYMGSSLAAAKYFIYDLLKEKYNYNTFEECFDDRVNHRKEWHDLICEFNKNDKCRLAKEIFKENDIYVGMRDKDEFDACVKEKIFDKIIGIYDPRKPLEPLDSFNIDIFKVCDIIICNNDSLDKLRNNIELIFH